MVSMCWCCVGNFHQFQWLIIMIQMRSNRKVFDSLYAMAELNFRWRIQSTILKCDRKQNIVNTLRQNAFYFGTVQKVEKCVKWFFSRCRTKNEKVAIKIGKIDKAPILTIALDFSKFFKLCEHYRMLKNSGFVFFIFFLLPAQQLCRLYIDVRMCCICLDSFVFTLRITMS